MKTRHSIIINDKLEAKLQFMRITPGKILTFSEVVISILEKACFPDKD